MSDAEGRTHSVERVRLASGVLRSTCSKCERFATAQDKGLNRATLAAWESRHGANCTLTAPARVQSPEGDYEN